MSEFIIDVKRKKTEDDEDLWTAKVNNKIFTSSTEADLREQVRLYLISVVAQASHKDESQFEARLARTWRVRISEKDSTEEDDTPLFSLFD